MQRVDALVEQHGRIALADRCVGLVDWVRRNDDSWHNSLLGIRVMSSHGHCCSARLKGGLILSRRHLRARRARSRSTIESREAGAGGVPLEVFRVSAPMPARGACTATLSASCAWATPI